jgi:hypothetical protein
LGAAPDLPDQLRAHLTQPGRRFPSQRDPGFGL